MSIPRLAASVLLMCLATIGWSQTSPEDHAAHHPPEKAQAAAPPEAIPAAKMPESTADLAWAGGLIERAERAKTAAERDRLLDEHLIAMRKQLDSLQSRDCKMEKLDGGAMGAKPPDGAKPGMMGDGMKKDHMMMCHQMMKARMDTLTELLEQTWRREELRKKGAK